MRIGQLLEAMKNLFLILLLIQSSSSLQLIKGTNCSDTQLETFQKKLDLSYSHVEHNCHLEVKEKLVQMSENTVSTVKGPLVKYLRKFSTDLYYCYLAIHALGMINLFL